MVTRSPRDIALITSGEELSWSSPVVLHAESRAPDEGERGFTVRLHGEVGCPQRLVPDGLVVTRSYDHARADQLCPRCTHDLVALGTSSVVAHLRDSLRTLHRLAASVALGPQPREIVHARALRFEASQVTSVHPAAADLCQEIAQAADSVVEALRQALLSYDAGRR